MKKIFIFSFLFLLGACTCVGDKQTNTILNVARPRSIGTLQEKTPEQTASILGDPSFIRKEGQNQSWTYKAPDCSLFVFFNDEGLSSYTETKGSCDKNVARRILAERESFL